MTYEASFSPIRDRIRKRLHQLYGTERGSQTATELFQLVDKASTTAEGDHALSLSAEDGVLITYGDMVYADDEPPLETLNRLLRETIHPVVNSVHILPFYPYSSDDGFSVIDYFAVDPQLGTWAHIQQLGETFKLMFDAVFNHISSQSAWFQGFLDGKQPYADYFITVDPNTDLSDVVRPRALPLLTPFDTANGRQHVWTTFSADQIDVNVQNPQVLLELIKALVFYVEQGARLIRLDAIAFLWKEIGTSCIHLEQTHLIIQLMRDVLDMVAPSTIIITETNVPHEENISYFGDGTNEAQMVYQFALPPLIYHTLTTGDASKITRWAATLKRRSDRTTFFNFTASHDGIGLRPVTGILSQDEIDALVATTQAHGGRVSFKSNADGTQSPYEMNINYFDAMTHPGITAREPQTAVQRFIVSQAIALSLIGVPGIYFHSLFGSRNDTAGVERSGHNRAINRQKLPVATLQRELADTNSIRQQVYSRYRALLTVRTREAAFDPLGHQTILDLSPAVFAVERYSRDRSARIVALHNIQAEPTTLKIAAHGHTHWHDLLTREAYTAANDEMAVVLKPYQILWLKPD